MASSSQEGGFAVVGEKLTYTNVIEPLDEDSVLSEYVMAEELDALLLDKGIPSVVLKSEEPGLFKSEEVQEPSSPNGSDLSIRPEELSESILDDLPVSPSLQRDDYQVDEQVTCYDVKKEVSSDNNMIKKVPEGWAPEKPLSVTESQAADVKPSSASRLFALMRLAVLALLVSGGLHTRLQLSWSLSSCGDAFGEEMSMDAQKVVLGNDKDTADTFAACDLCELVNLSQDPTEELTVGNNEVNALSIIPTLKSPESSWGALLAQFLALTVSMYSVTLLTSEQSEEDKETKKHDRVVKSSRFEDIRLILIETKKNLRRNGRRSRKESELKGYNMTNYERLSVEDLQKILALLNQPVKGDKQRLIKVIITEYSRQLAFLTKVEIIKLLELRNVHVSATQKKAEMIKALAEAAF